MPGHRRTPSLPLLLSITALIACSTVVGSPSNAAATCGDVPPAAAAEQEARSITASDALAILQTAVGTRTCATCICDANDSGTVTATDALAVLRFAVGQPVTLHCPDCSVGPDTAVLATAYCDFLTRCQPVLFDYRHWTLESCVTSSELELERGYAAVDDAIAAGRTELVAEEFEACIAAYQQADCDLGLTDECTFLHGKRSVNQGCSWSNECADGLFCDAPSPPACGVCRERAAVGQDCSTKVCIAGTACLDIGSSVACIPDEVEEGDPCGTVETGLCRGQLQCGGPDNLCLRPARIDETCDVTAETGPDCAIYQKADCSNDKCIELVVQTAGGACNTDGLLCDVDSRCDFVTSKCVALPGLGQSCQSFYGCATGLYCGGNGKCATLGGPGDTCVGNGDCLKNLFCTGPQGSRTCALPSYGACP